MLTVPGIIDEEGQLHLEEKLLEKGKKAKVFVTLVEEISEDKPKPKRQLGLLQGTFTDPYWSSEEFNDPLDDLKDYM